MAKKHAPRKGSMQVWPRKRSKRSIARVRSWPAAKDVAPLGFAGYKVGMTHVMATDNRKTSTTKGMQLSIPVTVIECPPIRVFGVRGYKRGIFGLKAAFEAHSKHDKDLARKLTVPKKEGKLDDIAPDDFSEFRLIVHTQPRLTGIGNKKPEVFELGLGGKAAEQLEYAKGILGKDIHVADLFKPGEQIDIHAVTKGKGFQGPVKRFGIKRTSHKSEKSVRTPGSLGGWVGQSLWMYRVAKAGKMGYHVRTDYNKWIIGVGNDPKDINVSGGFVRYGEVKNTYLLVKGSVQGSVKRPIRFNKAIRPSKKIPGEAPSIEKISLSSKQGR